MRPRVAFAILLAIGAVMHFALLTSSPRSFLPLATYCSWLLLSGVVAAIFWVRSRHETSTLERRRLIRGQHVDRPRVEGLGWFTVTAAVGLVMHLLNAAIASGKSTQQRGMWLLFFIFAVSCSAQLRGPPGDQAAPIPDDSALSRTATSVRRAVGVIIACVGTGLIYLGSTSGTPSDGFGLVITWLFKAGGVAFVLIGLTLALLPERQ
jgi:hypothetical protein